MRATETIENHIPKLRIGKRKMATLRFFTEKIINICRIAIGRIRDLSRMKMDVRISHEQIAQSLGLSKGVVGKYVGLTKNVGLDWPAVRLMRDAELKQRLYVRQQPRFPYVRA